MEAKILGVAHPQVVVPWPDFEKILLRLKKKDLIKLLAWDEVSAKRWARMSRNAIIRVWYWKYED